MHHLLKRSSGSRRRIHDRKAAGGAPQIALFKEVSARQNEYFDGDDLHRKVNAMIQTFTLDYFQTRSDFGQKSELPVFIVGMPRSGTTLVEQIVAAITVLIFVALISSHVTFWLSCRR